MVEKLKKRWWPSLRGRPFKFVHTKCRRSKKKQNKFVVLKIMYANIQGFVGKKTSLLHTMNEIDADVVLVAETMARKVTLQGCHCVCPKESIGQNVAIVLSGRTCSYRKIKLYEPNETINMLGIRLEIKEIGIRLYTAHLKQQSTHSKEEISNQFDEIKNQFRSASAGRESMLMVFDANVHVGAQGIKQCKDMQDMGGKMLLSVVKEEGLTIVNDLTICSGTVTRVDPRNGTLSTIDLAICNTFMMERLEQMVIDENEHWKLKKYGKKVTKSDHHTIVVDIRIEQNMCGKDETKQKRYNLRNEGARQKFSKNFQEDISFDELFVDPDVDVNVELQSFNSKWDEVIRKSFQEVKPSKRRQPGVDPEVKVLLKRESWIRRNVTNNAERGRAISEVQKLITQKISENLTASIEAQIQEIVKSDNPHSKVFGVRRKTRMNSNVDFPLRDGNGVLQVSKPGIDHVITEHFRKVFAQNQISNQEIWKDYWELVDQTFNTIDMLTSCRYDTSKEPTEEEIECIIKNMSASKSVYGNLTIDLAKLCGKRLSALVYRCILKCFRKNVLPSLLRKEKMTLLLKNNGTIDIINDYRGIFIRHLIISVYQKWLYVKNSGVVDQAGSEFACGGRMERSVSDALLIVKLIQDYMRWTNKELVIKFLDIEKFFDSMNYKLALIEAFRNGVTGRYWQCYKTINSKKICIPHIPSGTCSEIEVDNVFVQGSCDAVLVAWPLVDADSKRPGDCFSSELCIDGISVNKLSFVDDLIGFNADTDVANETTVSNEVFEKKNRLKFKVSKCKVMGMNCRKKGLVELNGEEIEWVKEHVYLGSIISDNGERKSDMNARMTKSNSVANEIVQICKTTELSSIRLWYVKLLTSSCLDSTIKFGSALWNIMKYKTSRDKLNTIKPQLLKRVLQIPSSTPSAAIQYEFGINDLAFEVLVEKIILAVETLRKSEGRIARKLLVSMLKKNVPGFCTELVDACALFQVSLVELQNEKNVREFLKKKVIEMQAAELLKRMIISSKMDKVMLSGFVYNGCMMKYLRELNFNEARAIFMARYRMWPTKENFPGRWSGVSCNVCGARDTDQHVFSCPGYADIIQGKYCFDVFWDKNVLNDIDKLKEIAKVVLLLIERMENIQNIGLTCC